MYIKFEKIVLSSFIGQYEKKKIKKMKSFSNKQKILWTFCVFKTLHV